MVTASCRGIGDLPVGDGILRLKQQCVRLQHIGDGVHASLVVQIGETAVLFRHGQRRTVGS